MLLPTAPTLADDRDAVRREMDDALDALGRLVRIQSVSTVADRASLVEAAEMVADLCRAVGLTVALHDVPESAAPLVVAERPAAPGSPTVLFYSHYDVVDVAAGSWRTPPWLPTLRSGRLFGRGAADNKYGIVAALTALRLVLPTVGVGVKVIVEGSEETPDDHFVRFVEHHPELFDADVAIVADAVAPDADVPTITASLRGLLVADVTLSTMHAPVHSGLFGGVAPDANMAMAKVLASLVDERGTCAIAGLDSRPADSLDELPIADDDVPLRDGVALSGVGSFADRISTGPSVAVIGIDASPTRAAPGVISGTCVARVSIRLHPAQSIAAAHAALVAHVAAVRPWNAHADVQVVSAVPGFGSEPTSAAARHAQASLHEAFERPVTVVGGGGCIPVCSALRAANRRTAVVLWGVADHASNVHGADESIDVEAMTRLTLATVRLVRRMAQQPAPTDSESGPA